MLFAQGIRFSLIIFRHFPFSFGQFNLQHLFKGQHLFSLLCYASYSTHIIRCGQTKDKNTDKKEKAEEGAAKKRRSSLRKWSIYPCYESLESWVRISFTPSFVFSKSQRKWERLSASGKNDKKES